jgi:hypothetical protein
VSSYFKKEPKEMLQRRNNVVSAQQLLLDAAFITPSIVDTSRLLCNISMLEMRHHTLWHILCSEYKKI